MATLTILTTNTVTPSTKVTVSSIIAGIFFVAWLTAEVHAASIMLQSGDIVEGTIVYETNSEIRVEQWNQARTICKTRVVRRYDIKSIQNDSPEQKAEVASFEALRDNKPAFPTQKYLDCLQNRILAGKGFLARYPKSEFVPIVESSLKELNTKAYATLNGYQLKPNDAFSREYCTTIIALFDEFIGKFPNSVYLPELRKRILDWQAEMSHDGDGLVKYDNKWMGVDEKKKRVAFDQQKLLEKQIGNIILEKNRLLQLAIYVDRQIGKAHADLDEARRNPLKEPVYTTQPAHSITPDMMINAPSSMGTIIIPPQKVQTGWKYYPNFSIPSLEKNLSDLKIQQRDIEESKNKLGKQAEILEQKLKEVEQYLNEPKSEAEH